MDPLADGRTVLKVRMRAVCPELHQSVPQTRSKNWLSWLNHFVIALLLADSQ
jgi:hypothetical protein